MMRAEGEFEIKYCVFKCEKQDVEGSGKKGVQQSTEKDVLQWMHERPEAGYV